MAPPRTPAAPDVGLAITGLAKAFGSTQALIDVDMRVSSGAIHGLLGGNGSGKSTLIKTLAGVHRADAGTCNVYGQTIALPSITPAASRAAGMRFVHQNPAILGDLTVAENIAFGASFPRLALGINWRTLRTRTRRLLERFEIDARPDDEAARLRPSVQTMVAVARALQDTSDSSQALLVLDEPTASLPRHEVEVLQATLRRLATVGQTILYVSHRIDEVLQITDEVTVLRDGRVAAARSTGGLSEDELIGYITGRSVDRLLARPAQPQVGHDVRLEVRHLAGAQLKDVSLGVHAGEVLGVAGLLGSGRTELLQMIFGLLPYDSGEILIAGQPSHIRRPADAMKLGVGLIPENRDSDAAFLDQTVTENFAMATLARYRSALRYDHHRERADAASAFARLAVRAAGPSALMSSLSGGNQQKVVVARWLQRSPAVMLLDEPTQGVDIGARADIYRALREAVKDGMAVILVASDLDELVRASDRIVVLRGGRTVLELEARDVSSDDLESLVHRSDESE